MPLITTASSASVSGFKTSGGFGGYPFTTATFTSGGVGGRTGPSLAQARSGLSGPETESWKYNTENFNTSNGIQLWTVPKTGTYAITATGAGAFNYRVGGYGATLTGNVNLTLGMVIQILVGQIGSPSGAGSQGNAAGGTFVTKAPHNTNASILLIAGGGGGGHGAYGYPSGIAQSNADAYGTSGQAGFYGSYGGTGGYGGGTSDGGGGGGFFGPGGGSGQTGGGGVGGGFAYIDGGYGSDEPGDDQDGGFGGGGSSGSSHGGGGGGYSGGGGSGPSPHHGGGGGSYSANATSVRSQTNYGSASTGSVVITFLSA